MKQSKLILFFLLTFAVCLSSQQQIIETNLSEIARFESSANSKWISMYQNTTRRGLLWSVGNDIKMRADNGNFAIQTGSTNEDYLVVRNGSGYVGINYTTPGLELTVGEDLSAGNFQIQMRSGTNAWQMGASSTNSFRLTQLGAASYAWLNPSSATWNLSSDRRLKENIKLVGTGVLDKINALQVKDFNYIGSKEPVYGLIAQEVEDIFPRLVSEQLIGEDDSEILKSLNIESVKGLDYTQLIFLTIKALQEQQEEIESLKNKIKELEE